MLMFSRLFAETVLNSLEENGVIYPHRAHGKELALDILYLLTSYFLLGGMYINIIKGLKSITFSW